MSAENKELIDQVLRARKGDREALSWLVRLVQDRLYRFCLYLARDPALAQDLCQDALIKAMSNLHQLKEPGRFESWILKSARNLFLDHVKSPANQPFVPLENVGNGPEDGLREIADPAHSDTATQAGGMTPGEANLDIRRALGALPPDDRLILLLVDLEGHSYQEAAGIAGITESSLRFRLHHIRKAFIEKLKK